jgi:hypothetical protein
MITYLRNAEGETVPTAPIPLDLNIALHLHHHPFRACPCECHKRPDLLIDLSTNMVLAKIPCELCQDTMLVSYSSMN